MGIIRYIGKELFVISVVPQMEMPQMKIIKIINASCLVFGLFNAHFTGRSHTVILLYVLLMRDSVKNTH